MFKKLISNLPFNPGLIEQVAFYGKRLHKEESIRKISFGFMAATLVVNILALAVPAQNTLATSPNDMIYGAKSKETVITALTNDRDGLGRTDIKEIYEYYGITLSDVQNAQSVGNIWSTDANYVTTGRWLSPGDDDPQTIPGAQTTVYERSLRVWDIENPRNFYPAISGTATGNGKLKGQKFWILLKGCGNITYIPQPKTPKIEIKKTRLSADKLRPGQSVSYRIDYRNSGTAASTGTLVADVLNAGLSYVSATPAPSKVDGNKLEWSVGNLEPSSEWHQITITASVKNITTATSEICNVAGIYTANAGAAGSENPCFQVDNRCPGTDLPAPDGDINKCTITCPGGEKVPYNEPNKCPTPIVTCVDLVLIQKPEWNERTVRLTIRKSTGAEINKISFLVDDKTDGSKNSPVDQEDYTYKNLSEGNHTFKVRFDIRTGQLQSSQSCEVVDEVKKPVPGISAIKKVKNKTKGVENADGTTVSAGDIIEYTLITTNSGTGAAKGYVIKPDSLGPVLEYADLKEVGDATFDQTSLQLSWPPLDIRPGESITKVFSVQVKSPIPLTAPSQSDPAGRQFKICNKYGNNTCVNIQKPLPAAIQTTAKQLPNTGPGSSLVMTFITVMIIGFFYTRSRVLAKEIDIVRHEYSKVA